MAKDKSNQMDLRGLEVLADEFTGDVTGTVAITAPVTDPTWTDVQTALDDIAARLAVLEP